MKKKKKKKTGFDLDAALAADGASASEPVETVQNDDAKQNEGGDNGYDDDLDLEDFGKKKKKKKKKPFNDADLLPEDRSANVFADEENKEENDEQLEEDLDMDFSSKKKKRSKKKGLEEILDKPDDEEDKENGKLSSFGSFAFS